MSSSDLLDLERDLPTTPEDIEALRRVRRIRPSDPFAAVQILSDSLPPETLVTLDRQQLKQGVPAAPVVRP